MALLLFAAAKPISKPFHRDGAQVGEACERLVAGFPDLPKSADASIGEGVHDPSRKANGFHRCVVWQVGRRIEQPHDFFAFSPSLIRLRDSRL